MKTKVDLLKELALKITSATSINDVEGDTISEVLSYIVKNFKINVGNKVETEKLVVTSSVDEDLQLIYTDKNSVKLCRIVDEGKSMMTIRDDEIKLEAPLVTSTIKPKYNDLYLSIPARNYDGYIHLNGDQESGNPDINIECNKLLCDSKDSFKISCIARNPENPTTRFSVEVVDETGYNETRLQIGNFYSKLRFDSDCSLSLTEEVLPNDVPTGAIRTVGDLHFIDVADHSSIKTGTSDNYTQEDIDFVNDKYLLRILVNLNRRLKALES